MKTLPLVVVLVLTPACGGMEDGARGGSPHVSPPDLVDAASEASADAGEAGAVCAVDGEQGPCAAFEACTPTLLTIVPLDGGVFDGGAGPLICSPEGIVQHIALLEQGDSCSRPSCDRISTVLPCCLPSDAGDCWCYASPQ